MHAVIYFPVYFLFLSTKQVSRSFLCFVFLWIEIKDGCGHAFYLFEHIPAV